MCTHILVLALLHDATFLYVEAEAAVAHAPMNSVSDVGVATAYLLILRTTHMQASESLTARSLKANLRVLRLGCNCSILILIEPDAVDLFQGPDSGLALLGSAWLWRAHAHTRTHVHMFAEVGCAAYVNEHLLSTVRSSSMGPILGKRCYSQIVDSHRGALCTGEMHP